MECLDKLKHLKFDFDDRKLNNDCQLDDKAIQLLNELTELCCIEGSGNAAIAARNGALELLCFICSKAPRGCARGLVSVLNALASLLHGIVLSYYLLCSILLLGM